MTHGDEVQDAPGFGDGGNGSGEGLQDGHWARGDGLLLGVPVFDYRMYPIANSMADKICAMFEMHDGIASSRVKDLVDVLVYADTCDLDGSEVVECVRLESRLRQVELPERFAVPEVWHGYYANSYRKMVAQTGLPERVKELGVGEELAAGVLDPVLVGDAAGMVWDHVAHVWRERS